MTFTFPQNAHDFLVMLVPFLTLLLGLVFLIIPGRLLHFMGLEPRQAPSGGFSGGRWGFASGLLAVGLGCLLLQEPIALQPGLNFILALGWSLSAFGRLLQMLLDNGLKRKRIQTRFIIASILSVLAWSVADVPYFACADPASVMCSMPVTLKDQVLAIVAGATFVAGLVAMLLPGVALKALGLQVRINAPFARGEARGTLAGFSLAIGGTYLLMPQPVDFVALVLAASWVMAGIGRLAALVFDRAWSKFNLILMLIQGGIGALCLAFILRLI